MPDTGERVSQANPICNVCSGTGMHPGTNNGEKCGVCGGFGRTGAKKTDDAAFVDSPGAEKAADTAPRGRRTRSDDKKPDEGSGEV